MIVDCDLVVCFFFQAEDGIRDLVRSRGLGDVYKRQSQGWEALQKSIGMLLTIIGAVLPFALVGGAIPWPCLLYTSDRCRRAI